MATEGLGLGRRAAWCASLLLACLLLAGPGPARAETSGRVESPDGRHYIEYTLEGCDLVEESGPGAVERKYRGDVTAPALRVYGRLGERLQQGEQRPGTTDGVFEIAAGSGRRIRSLCNLRLGQDPDRLVETPTADGREFAFDETTTDIPPGGEGLVAIYTKRHFLIGEVPPEQQEGHFCAVTVYLGQPRPGTAAGARPPGTPVVPKVSPVPEESPTVEPEPSPAAPTGPEAPTSQKIPTWVVVGLAAVGAAAAALAAALAAAAVAAARKGGQDTPEPPQVAYILGIEPTSMCLAPGGSGPLTAAAYRVAAVGGPTLATEAALKVSVTGCPDLSVSPASGAGSLHCAVAADAKAAPGEATLTVTASGGGGGASATVRVRIEAPPTSMELLAQPAPPLALDDPDGLWVYARVVATEAELQAAAVEATRTIRFDLCGPNTDCLQRREESEVSGYRSLRLTASRPAGSSAQAGAPSCGSAEVSGQRLEGALQIPLSEDLAFGAWVRERAQADVFFDGAQKAWAFPEIVSFYYARAQGPAQERPTKPGFPCQKPLLQADSDVLDFEMAPDEGDDRFVFRVRLRPDVDLDRDFPGLLTDQALTVTLTASGEGGTTLSARVAYRLRPRFRIVAYCYDQDARLRDGHSYQDLDLEEGEFAADARDELKMVAFLVRTDREVPAGLEYTEACSDGELAAQQFQGPEAGEFEVSPEPGDTGEGFFAWRLRARRPLLYTDRARKARLALRLEGKPRASAPKNYDRTAVRLEVGLLPQHLFLKLWVVPGWVPGTSQAAAFVRLPRHPEGFLADVPVELAVENPANGAILAIRGASGQVTAGDNPSQTVFIDPDSQLARPVPSLVEQLPRGACAWTLGYSGMRWEALGETVFHVKCGFPDAQGRVREATSVSVDVGYNLARLLADVYEGRSSADLNLNNPEWNDERFGVVRRALGRLFFADWMCGPVQNMADGGGTFSCGQYSARIYRYLFTRRFLCANRSCNPESLALMNGIEANQYSMYMIANITHHYAGIHLSGSSPVHDPRFFDPWWAQNWDRPEYRTGLLTRGNERSLMLRSGAYVVSTVVAAACAVIVAGRLVGGAAGKVASEAAKGAGKSVARSAADKVIYGVLGTLYGLQNAANMWVGVDQQQHDVSPVEQRVRSKETGGTLHEEVVGPTESYTPLAGRAAQDWKPAAAESLKARANLPPVSPVRAW